jgi:mono/diheme cytochrome c family protein
LYGPNLTNVYERLPHEMIVISIINGRAGGTPAYAGNITLDELNAIVAFLEAEKVQKGEGEPPRDTGDTGAQVGR